MPLHFAANLTMLYYEVPFLKRFEQAAAAGFRSVEFLFPYEVNIDAIKTHIDNLGLKVALFNLHAGDQERGEFGTLSNPDRKSFFRWSFATALDVAERLRCRRLHTMFGNRLPELARETQIACAMENLAWAAPQALEAGVMLLVEWLNPTDFPSFLLHSRSAAMDIVTQANHPSVKLQFDVYHAQMTEGNLINSIKDCFPHIGHIQIADVPGRHQPGTGEINYPNIFATLEEIGYQGYIGLEYQPLGGTSASLSWLPAEDRGAR